jgi:hypothetical protein
MNLKEAMHRVPFQKPKYYISISIIIIFILILIVISNDLNRHEISLDEKYGTYIWEIENIDAYEDEGWGGCQNFSCNKDDDNKEYCERLLFDMYKKIGQLLEINQSQWLVEGSYMLQVLRGNTSLMPDRHDIDIILSTNELLELLSLKLHIKHTLGYHIFIDKKYKDGRVCVAPDNPILLEKYNLPNDGSMPGVHIDLEPYGFSHIHNGLRIETIPCTLRDGDSDLFPRDIYYYKDFFIPIPREAEALAIFTYGPEWRSSTRPWDANLYECGPHGGFSYNIKRL